VAVIADGVGSAKNSDVGAKLAVDTVVNYVHDRCSPEWNTEELQNVLRVAYETALEKITERAEADGESLSDYDTTLTTAVYNGNQIVYAHVGDGGIVTLSKDGDFAMLTSPQKGEEFNSVSPLRSKKAWAFGESNQELEICALAMFTDGIYDVVCPWLLSQQEQKIYVNYIRPFMDRNILKSDTMEDFEVIKREAEAFLNSEQNAGITDDKTVAVVINTDFTPAVKNIDYYTEPDWVQLQSENKQNLYNCEGKQNIYDCEDNKNKKSNEDNDNDVSNDNDDNGGDSKW
jgi:serine/threonine protein phosphatase PrpC